MHVCYSNPPYISVYTSHCNTTIQYKTLAVKGLANKDYRNFGGKKLWQIEVHLHRECYGNCEHWRNAVIRQSFSPPMFFTVR